MNLRGFTVRFKENCDREYNIKVVAADEFSAAHVVEYLFSGNARAKTKVVDVRIDDAG